MRKQRCKHCAELFGLTPEQREKFCSPQCRHAAKAAEADWHSVQESATAPTWKR